MAFRTILKSRVKTQPTTTNGTTWVTLMEIDVSAYSHCVFQIHFSALGRDTGTDDIASAYGMHRGRILGTPLATPWTSLVGSILFLCTFNTGSAASLASCNARLQIDTGSPEKIQLQVKGVAGKNILWDGTLKVHIN